MDSEDSTHNLLEHMLLDKNAEPTDLPVSLLKAITKNFSDDLLIGSGGFAAVYKGLLRNGETVAVKKLYNTLDMDENKYNQEVGCLMRVKHKNIVRFLGYCADTQGKMCNYGGKFVMADVRQRLLCFEYLPEGSLHKFITDASGGLEWRARYQIIKGICAGLHYLHGKRIVHLDLKPTNILLDDNMVPKIVDFGLSKCFDEKQSRAITSKLVGTTGYLAPEFYSHVITFKSDIYSLGVIIQEILTGQKGYSEIENVLQSWRDRIGLSPMTHALLGQISVCAEISINCMDYNPQKRPDAQRIIEKLDEAESTDEFTGSGMCTSSMAQIMPCYIDTELINIYPMELRFPFEPNKSIQCTFTYQQFQHFSLPQLVKDENVVGFKKDKELLKEWLSPTVSYHISNVSALKVVSVLGMGGMGKTTLVTSVYEKVKDSFDIHIWLTVSHTLKGVDCLLKELLKTVSAFEQTTWVGTDGGYKKQLKPEDVNKLGILELKVNLKDALKQKKCIVVLDDVWDRRIYDGISDVFEDFGKESRIVITTRKQDVAALATSGYQLELKPLDIKDALQLFCLKAFPNNNDCDWKSELVKQANGIIKKCKDLPLEQCPSELQELATHIVMKCEESSPSKCPSELQDLAADTIKKFHGLSLAKCPSELQDLAITIANKCDEFPLAKCPFGLQKLATDIVQRCRGLPLAIVSVGCLLSSRKQIEPVWRQMYNELPCELEKYDQVRGILNLSYYDMPSDLRNCFLYCCLFPEDYEFSRENVVRLWVAEGFVGRKWDSTPEEVAEVYLMELIHRNMLQLVDNDELGRVNTCRMHDILRELALSISKTEMFGTVNDFGALVRMDTDMRRISSYGWKKMKKYTSKMKFPHLRTLIGSDSIVDYVPSILSESKYLTVLELQNSDFRELPTSVGNLVNLRYIGLRNTRVTSLPDSIKNLSNLQTLDVKSTGVRTLPSCIVKLTKLRHLLADRFADEKQSEFRYFVGVEAPKGLSNLEELQTLETVQASKDLSEQLDKLLQLGSLWIDNITAAHCAELFSTLSTMPLLSSLLLSASDEKEELFFKDLNPTSTRLHKLIIRGCLAPGTMDCPIFQNYGGNLKYLALSGCHFREDPLVVLASCVPNLTYLRLNKISSPHILALSAGSFPHLQTLILKDMPEVDLLEISDGAVPTVEGLYITSLSKLATVPQGIRSLGSLKKLWLLGLHMNFKTQWKMLGMQKDLQHVPEIKV